MSLSLPLRHSSHSHRARDDRGGQTTGAPWLRRLDARLILKTGPSERFAERRVNQGGEPGHDDYGLPRVDIQVPDDARELYRDVQAYHRELRALRRHERSRRWRAPLRKSSMILPVIAGCLVLAMIAGMVLTMFSANPYFPVTTGQARTRPAAGTGHAGTSQPGGSPAPSSSSSSSPSATSASSGGPSQPAAQRLPADTIKVAGEPGQPAWSPRYCTGHHPGRMRLRAGRRPAARPGHAERDHHLPGRQARQPGLAGAAWRRGAPAEPSS